MQWREVEPDVFYTDDEIVFVSDADLKMIESKARSSARGRARLCAHASPASGLHEMLVCLSRTTYIRPHRHFKPESASIIRGATDLVFFDEQGSVREVHRLGAVDSKSPFFARIPDGTYHTYLVNTETLVFLETTTGPFERQSTEYAPWAPKELDPTGSYQKSFQTKLADFRASRKSSVTP